jgi:hypothetical protein
MKPLFLEQVFPQGEMSMVAKLVNVDIAGEVVVGPPILMIEGAHGKKEQKSLPPEKLRAFEEGLTKLFGIDTGLLSAEHLNPAGSHPQPRACLACGTHDNVTQSSHWDDIVVQVQ